MATCSAGPRRCRIVCNGGCGCIYSHDTDSCTCECFDDAGSNDFTLGLGAVVSVSVSGLSLGQLASRFDRLLAREVMVPAARTGEPITIRLKRVRVSAALKTLGLASRVSPRPGRPAKRGGPAKASSRTPRGRRTGSRPGS